MTHNIFRRIARVVVFGLPHHLTQRGVRRGETFFSEDDYAEYVSFLLRGEPRVWRGARQESGASARAA